MGLDYRVTLSYGHIIRSDFAGEVYEAFENLCEAQPSVFEHLELGSAQDSDGAPFLWVGVSRLSRTSDVKYSDGFLWRDFSIEATDAELAILNFAVESLGFTPGKPEFFAALDVS